MVTLLMKLREIRNSLTEEKQAVGLGRILESSSKSQFILMVGEAMKSNPEMEPKPVLQYFQFLTHRPLVPLSGVKPIGIRQVAEGHRRLSDGARPGGYSASDAILIRS